MSVRVHPRETEREREGERKREMHAKFVNMRKEESCDRRDGGGREAECLHATLCVSVYVPTPLKPNLQKESYAMPKENYTLQQEPYDFRVCMSMSFSALINDLISALNESVICEKSSISFR